MSAPLLFALVDAAGNAIPLRATADGRLIVQVEGLDGVQVDVGPTVEISNDLGNPIPVSGPLTDAQLRAAAVATQGVVIATNGTPLATGSLPQELAYDAAGRLSTVTVMVAGVAYRRTLTYDVNGRVSSVSAWGLV